MVSFVIMLLIWVGNQALTIYLSFLIVLPLIYTNTLAGFLNVDPEMLEMAETFRLSRWKAKKPSASTSSAAISSISARRRSFFVRSGFIG